MSKLQTNMLKLLARWSCIAVVLPIVVKFFQNFIRTLKPP